MKRVHDRFQADFNHSLENLLTLISDIQINVVFTEEDMEALAELFCEQLKEKFKEG